MDSTPDEVATAAATEAVAVSAVAVAADSVSTPAPAIGRRVDPPHRPSEPLTVSVEMDSVGVDEDPAPFGLRRGDRMVLIVAAGIGLTLAGVHWARLSGWGLKPIEIDRPAERRFEYRLDANSATWVEWMQLPGIGETLARRIVEDRETHGPFRTVEDIGRVKGIGPKTLEKLRPWITVTPSADQSARREAGR